jgi:hypothetical protein
MSMQKAKSVLLAIVALLAASAAPALDDLTGTYTGKFDCQGTSDVDEVDIKLENSLYVDEAASGTAYVYINNTLTYFRTAIVSAPGEDDRGRVGGPDCNASPSNGGSFLQAEVKAKPGSGKATLKGDFVTLGVGGSPHIVQVCRLNLKRVSTTIPAPIPGCPL